MLPYKNIEGVEKIQTPISPEMTTALDLWYNMYLDKAPWLAPDFMKSLGLPSFICAEIARQMILEMKWSITAKTEDGTGQNAEGKEVTNPRAEFLAKEFGKCIRHLRRKLEQGCAAGGMIIKPYCKVDDQEIFFDWSMDWDIYPVSFDDDGNISDIVFRDSFTEGDKVYTRLERHTVEGKNVHITQRAFVSTDKAQIGTEIKLTDVPVWANVEPEAIVTGAGGQLFGWYKVASANNVDVDSPMGSSVFAKAVNLIRDADEQYSRLMWEFEGSELAVDVDPNALIPRMDGRGKQMPRLNERLFRSVDTGVDGLYEVYAPSIRDASIINGLNQILSRIEDECGLSRGTLTEADSVAKTATELRILKQRAYTTIADNQAALEICLRDVIRTMDVYATAYKLSPEGDYDVSFEWDDSIITDTAQQLEERMMLLHDGVISKAELRQWYLGETAAQAEAGVKAAAEEKKANYEGLATLLPTVTP